MASPRNKKRCKLAFEASKIRGIIISAFTVFLQPLTATHAGLRRSYRDRHMYIFFTFYSARLLFIKQLKTYEKLNKN